MVLFQNQSFYSVDFEHQTHDHILQQFVEEIKEIETTGIKISADKTIYGTLVSVTFDNLGANSMLGFAESFSATYCCRICTMSR
jgi:hypothetical protein